jgi:hypothetical protein
VWNLKQNQYSVFPGIAIAKGAQTKVLYTQMRINCICEEFRTKCGGITARAGSKHKMASNQEGIRRGIRRVLLKMAT